VPGNEVNLDRDIILTEKERKQIELQRKSKFAKYEVHIEEGQPVRMVNIRENIKL